MDSRSFHYKGRRFPICARCTGELAGILFALATFPWFRPQLPAVLLLVVPMLLDGGLQMLTPYESGNIRRLLTGALFGYALVCLFLLSTTAVFRFGLALGEQLI